MIKGIVFYCATPAAASRYVTVSLWNAETDCTCRHWWKWG